MFGQRNPKAKVTGYGTKSITPAQAVAAVNILRAEGKTLPEAVAAVIIECDEASVDAILAHYGV